MGTFPRGAVRFSFGFFKTPQEVDAALETLTCLTRQTSPLTSRNASVFTLQSIYQVVEAEKALQRAGLAFDFIPVSKEVNPECGMAIETSAQETRAVRALLA